jgi:hypothetical protein
MGKTKKPRWDQLSQTEQDLYLTILWNDGHSEGAIAKFLGASKGQIVRRRQTGLKLPTEGRGTIKSTVDPGHFKDLLDIHEMEQMEKRGVTAIAPVTAPINVNASDEELFVGLVLGHWRPVDSERPFARLTPQLQREVRYQAHRFMEFRQGIRQLRF